MSSISTITNIDRYRFNLDRMQSPPWSSSSSSSSSSEAAAADMPRATMKAIVTQGVGDYDQLQLKEVPIPHELKDDEVLLQVLAAGINNTDINTRLGWYSAKVTTGTTTLVEDQDETNDAKQSGDGGWNSTTPFPFIQGTDCCGRVVKVGTNNTNSIYASLLGKRVLVRACMRTHGWKSVQNIWMASDFDGAFAQFVKVPADEVFVVDCDWTHAELGSIPCSYGTAENLLCKAQLQAHDTILIMGASGGVASAAIQLAKCREATVIAVTSASKREQVLAIGADRVLDRSADLVDVLREESVDVVLDIVAGPNFGTMLQLMKRGGRYVTAGAIAGPLVTLDMRTLYLKDLTLLGSTAWVEEVFPNLISYIEGGQIKPLVYKTYPLEQIAQAQQCFMEKKHIGKFVLLPPELNEEQKRFVDRMASRAE